MPARWPTNITKTVTQDFGPSPISGEPTRYYDLVAGRFTRCAKVPFPGSDARDVDFHDGLDIRAPFVELVAILPGIVTAHPTWDTGTSLGVNRGIVYRVPNTPTHVEVQYWHCSPGHFAPIGTHLEPGDHVALSGKSGASLAHLHMGIYIMDPATGLLMRWNPELFMPAHRRSWGPVGADGLRVLIPAGPLYDSPMITPRLGEVTPIPASANVRPDPSTAAAPLGALANGSALHYVAKVQGQVINGNPAWFKVDWQGRWGYMSATVVKSV